MIKTVCADKAVSKKKLDKYAWDMYQILKHIVKEQRRLPGHVKDASLLLRSMDFRKAPALRPLRAFCAHVDGVAALYVPARSSSQARWVVVKEQRDAGYEDKGMFSLTKISRAKQYDAWAQAAEKRAHCIDEMPKLESACQTKITHTANRSTPTASPTLSASPTAALVSA